MKRFAYTMLMAILAVGIVSAAPMKALIVDGQNNHGWAACTPVLKEIIEETGLFTVDVATTPPQGQPMDSFKPDFAKYNVIVANYTGDDWPAATQAALEQYMTNGGGLVVIHAADNAFPKWVAWNEMIGLGGWGGRNEKSGPYVYWKDGKIVRDETPGPGGAHGAQVEYLVTARDTQHPITKGLPDKWLHVKDELYSRLRGPGKNMTVLATSIQDKATGGTGRDEPVLFTISYGKGRIFHQAMGHAPEQMRCVGFIVTTQRGTEWAATGKVTRTDVPADFPTATKTSVRQQISTKLDFSSLDGYDFEKPREGLAKIEEQVRNMPVSKYPAVEEGLLAAMKSPKITPAGKQWVCRMLRIVGSAKCVPAMAAMLSDKDTAHLARMALIFNPSPEAGQAMTKALATLTGDLRIGVIGSLGQRGETTAVAEIGKLVGDADANTALAAIRALGRIGGADAAKILAAAKVAPALQGERDDAVIAAADSLAKQGKTAEAMAIYSSMTDAKNTVWIRIAAYRGLVQIQKEKAVPQVIALLKDANADLKLAAGKFIAEMPGAAATKALADSLSTLDPQGQTVLIAALETRQDKLAAAAVTKAVDSGDAAVKIAAIKALAVLGDAGSVEKLATVAAAGGEPGKAAQQTLGRLSGSGVDDKIVGLIASPSATGAVRAAAIQASIDRAKTIALPALLKAAKDANADVQKAASRALGELAESPAFAEMVGLVTDAKNAAERGNLERAMTAMIARVKQVDVQPVIDALSRGGTEAKVSLLGMLPKIGGEKALAVVRTNLASTNPDVKKAAIRSLAEWPDPTPLKDLLELAQKDPDAGNQTLALRGYIALLSTPANRGASQTVVLLGDALKVAKRPEEKRQVLAALAKFPCKEALEMARQLKADAALSAEADGTIRKIENAMVSQTMKATASLGSDEAGNALDGKMDTRWSTGRPMKPGDWFVLDLGVERGVKGLTLDTTPSGNDFPKGYEVYVSFDGGNWGKPILVGTSDKPITELDFGKTVQARFIKIIQTGSSDSWHWSIHELKVRFE
jgi:HEAT repeat protein/type 1 glutamine amidotransferase